MDTKKETRGRKAIAPEQRKAPQATVKVNEVILPFVKELKGNLKNGKVTKKTIARLFNVLNNNWEQVNAADEELSLPDNDYKQLQDEVLHLKDELFKSHQSNATKPLESTERLELVEKYQNERSNVVRLEGQDRSNRSTIRGLKADINRINHLEHDCQALKSNGERCTRPAVASVDWYTHRVEIHVCNQHYKLLKGNH